MIEIYDEKKPVSKMFLKLQYTYDQNFEVVLVDAAGDMVDCGHDPQRHQLRRPVRTRRLRAPRHQQRLTHNPTPTKPNKENKANGR
jgi:hypothetical protein